MPKRLSEKEIFKTGVFTAKEIELEYDDGKRGTHQIIERPDVSIIVPLTDNGTLFLVKEYSTAFDEYRLDLPGGKIDPGNDALETANRELQEEIGFKAGRLDQIGTFTVSPGYMTQKSHIFIARNLSESKREGDEHEPLEIIKHPFNRFEELIESGQLSEARAIAALYLARNFLNKQK